MHKPPEPQWHYYRAVGVILDTGEEFKLRNIMCVPNKADVQAYINLTMKQRGARCIDQTILPISQHQAMNLRASGNLNRPGKPKRKEVITSETPKEPEGLMALGCFQPAKIKEVKYGNGNIWG